jgi:hypothetical protein
MGRGFGLAGYLALGACQAQTASPPMEPRATFGVTVVDNTGLEGKIHFLKRNTSRLPNFKR